MTETNIDRQIQNIIHNLQHSKSVITVLEDRYNHEFKYQNGFDPHDHIRALLSAAVEVSEKFGIDTEWMIKYLRYKSGKGTIQDEEPSHTVLPQEGGPASPPSHDERTLPESPTVTTSGNMASEQPQEGEVATSFPSSQQGRVAQKRRDGHVGSSAPEQGAVGGSNPPSPIGGSSGDVYEYYPRPGRDYE